MPIKNPNNPGNIKGGGKWKGLIGHDESGHNLYDTRVNGLRSMIRCIEQAILAGRDTAEKLTAGWTAVVADQRDYAKYIRNSSRWMKIGTLIPLIEESWIAQIEQWAALLRAMATFEHGENYGDQIPTSEILEALAAWRRDFHRD